MTVQLYNPSSSRVLRAQQAWPILIGAAHRGEILTYDELGLTMFEKTSAGVLAGILGLIAFWCRDEDLPALTSIVVNSETGMPGMGIPTEKPMAEQQKVFAYKWYLIHAPTEAELTEIASKYL